uniref:DNA-directed RNA polymerase III subunit RPC6 n=1 Tax=Panagrolaimus superbus TaxID=310955 RepID=A0A914Z6C6_9BILA
MSSSSEEKILAALKDAPEGIPSNQLKEFCNNEPVDKVINKLLGSRTVEMVSADAGGGFLLRLTKGTQLTDLTAEEQLVFSLIEESNTKGIWIKEIRDRSGLPETQMKRVLKNLEKKKLVKAIKAVGTTRKCYMLYNIEADESVSGGVFYSNQEVDSSFVQTLMDVSVVFLQKRHQKAFAKNEKKIDALKESCAHVSEVSEFIKSKNICTVAVNEADIDYILDLAWKHNRIYKTDTQGYYRYRPSKAGADGTTYAICNFCPVRSECHVGHKISPETCVYLTSVKNADPEDTTIDDLDYDSDY